MKNLNYFILIAISAIISSCSDFLEEIPKDSISPANFYRTAEDAEAAVNGAYAALQVNDYYARYWVTSSTHASDGNYTRLSAGSDRGQIITLNDVGMITSNRYNIAIWNAIWQAVNRANAVIDNVPAIDMDATKKNRIVGEAKFLRALNYFNLVRRWGGVPLVTNETNTSNLVELQVSRNSADEVYAQIVADLNDAVEALPNKSDIELGRASKEAAQGMLAKVQLYLKDWGGAKSNALAVINSPSGLTLMPDPKDNFWQAGGAEDNNAESIFEVQYNGSPQGHVLCNNFEHRGSAWGPGAWGTITASLYWYNQFSDDDKRKPVTFLSALPDARDPSKVKPWQDLEVASPGINKYREVSRIDASDQNIKIMRFADILLIAAEAINESEGPGGAFQYVNRVRARAGLPDLVGLSQDELRQAIYVEFRKELCYEGQDYEELVRQGRLLQQKVAFQTFEIPTLYDADGNAISNPTEETLTRIRQFQPGNYAEFFELDEHNTIFPLPQQALDKNPNLTQNPGYLR